MWQDKWHNTYHLGALDDHATIPNPHLPLHHSMVRAPIEPAPSLTTGVPAYNHVNKVNYTQNLAGGAVPPPPNVFQWHPTFCDQPSQQPPRPIAPDHTPAIGSTIQENVPVPQQQPTYSMNNRFDLLLRNQNHTNYLLSSFNNTSTNWCQQPSIAKDTFSPPSATKNTCPMCGKNYARPSTLKTHMRIHSGERPFLCNVCNKSFSQAANLTAHLRVHSGEKPFSCSICHKTFSQSSSVTTHMRTHSGDRPYKCPMCRKGFSDSSTLTKHLRIHSGEKPYQCNFCAMSFSQSGNLNRHMKVHEQNRTQMNDDSTKTSSPQ